jgi:hypothetical protein
LRETPVWQWGWLKPFFWSAMQTLNGKVTRVFYPKSPTPGFHVLLLEVARSSAKAVGNMTWTPDEGEMLEFKGNWGTCKRGDRQFEFREVVPYIPEDPRALLAYACEQTKGIGPAIESRIWDEWAEQWREDMKPDVVKGLGGEIYNALVRTVASLSLHEEKAKIVSSLMGLSCTARVAAEAWEKWEQSAHQVVTGNCYRLTEISGVGFKWVDEFVRPQCGIASDDPRRMLAATEYAAAQATENDTVFSRSDLHRAVTGLLGMGFEAQLQAAYHELLGSGYLREFPQAPGAVAVGLYADAEARIWEYANAPA